MAVTARVVVVMVVVTARWRCVQVVELMYIYEGAEESHEEGHRLW